MGIAVSFSAQLTGLHNNIVTIEVDISNGLNNFSVVGLGDRSVTEAKDRISAAIKNSGYISPKQKNQKVVISLAPADLRKEGSAFDLGMALTYLKAAQDISFDHTHKLFLGELSLEGNVRRVHGLLPILCQASACGFTEAFVPRENAREASLAQNIALYPVSSLRETVDLLLDRQPRIALTPYTHRENSKHKPSYSWVDMQTIRGNETAKRGLEIAAAGAHNILMCGSPGTGKTMLAQSLPSILPQLSYEQSIEVTSIHSVAGILDEDLIVHPPFRSPHHTASYASIVGGGAIPRPGEITLAHRGVLFLDEFAEFDRDVIESLRQPLEDRTITISRAKGVVTFPAQCMLIASMNPCPCGKGKNHGCTCPEHVIASYKRRISRAIFDRIDLWINVDKVDYDKLSRIGYAKEETAELSDTIRKRVQRARAVQYHRFKKYGVNKNYNSEMNARDIEKFIVITDDARTLLRTSAEKFNLSGRAFHRVIKVSQTIADMRGSEEIIREDILEALRYREKMDT